MRSLVGKNSMDMSRRCRQVNFSVGLETKRREDVNRRSEVRETTDNWLGILYTLK